MVLAVTVQVVLVVVLVATGLWVVLVRPVLVLAAAAARIYFLVALAPLVLLGHKHQTALRRVLVEEVEMELVARDTSVAWGLACGGMAVRGEV